MKFEQNIKKILLTGSSGMVGKNFLEHKDVENFDVFSPTRAEVDLLNFHEINNYIKKHKPDIIIHSAGLVGGIMANMKNPVNFLIHNSEIGKNLLMAAKEQKVHKLINLSSSCVYPKNINIALEEKHILTGELEPTNEAYALAKIYTQKLCEYIHQEDNNFLYKTLIPCNLFGRFDNFNLETGHLLPNIINKMHNAKIKNEKEIIIWGDGSVRREFMFVSDLIDCLFFSIKNFNNLPSVLNVGVGHDHTVLEYYMAVAEEFVWKGNFKFDLSKPIGQKQKLVSTKNLEKFGWKSRTNLKIAINKTIAFFLERNNDDL